MMKQEMMDLLLTGGEVLLRDEDGRWRLHRKAVAIKGDRIAALYEADAEMPPAGDRLNCSGMWIMPGQHNAHSHLLEIIQRSLRDNYPLEIWIQYKAALDRLIDLSPEESAAVIRLACLEMLQAGVTSVLHHYYPRPTVTEAKIDAAVAALHGSGLRFWLGPALLDRTFPETIAWDMEGVHPDLQARIANVPVQSTEELLALAEYTVHAARATGSGRAGAIIGPAAPQMTTRRLFEGSAELARRYGVPLHTHLMESRLQRLAGFAMHGKSLAHYLDELGALDANLSLAHSIWLDDADVELLAARGATVVHNPGSNLKLGSGISPIPAMLEAGVNVVLGTDGGDTSDSYSVLDQMRLAALIHKVTGPDFHHWVSAEQVFTMATVNAGKYLTGGETGEILPGKLADLSVMARGTRLVGAGEPVNALVHTGGGPVQHVVVDGQVVLRNGRAVLMDEEAVVAEVAEIVERRNRMHPGSLELGKLLEPHLRRLHLESAVRLSNFRQASPVRR